MRRDYREVRKFELWMKFHEGQIRHLSEKLASGEPIRRGMRSIWRAGKARHWEQLRVMQSNVEMIRLIKEMNESNQ